MGDTDVGSVNELTVPAPLQGGDTTTVTVIRAGQRMTMDITLDEKPRDTDSAAAGTDSNPNSNMPQNGEYDEWYDFFFGNRKNGN